MSNFDSIDEALDCESVIEPKIISLVDEPDEDSLTTSGISTMPDAQADYDYARTQLYSLIEKGQEAVNGALELAQEGDSARSYEVAINGIKNVSEVAEKLLDLQKKVKELDEVQVTNQTNVTNNSVFVGSTSDLQKMIKEGIMNNQLPEV